MNKVPNFADLNLDKIEKVVGVKFEDHHRQDLWKEVRSLQSKTRFFSNSNNDLPKLKKNDKRALKLVSQALKVVEGYCSPVLKLNKKKLTDFLELKTKLIHRGRGRSQSRKAETVCNIFKIYKDVGGKGAGAYWHGLNDKSQGKLLYLISKLFDHAEIKYSKNTVTKQIKATNSYFEAVQKAKDGISDHKLKNPAKRARFRDFVDAFRLLGLSCIEEKKKPIPRKRGEVPLNPQHSRQASRQNNFGSSVD